MLTVSKIVNSSLQTKICRCGDLYESFLLIEGKEGKMEHKRSHNRVVNEVEAIEAACGALYLAGLKSMKTRPPYEIPTAAYFGLQRAEIFDTVNMLEPVTLESTANKAKLAKEKQRHSGSFLHVLSMLQERELRAVE
ncbi:hypothetical protein PS1_037044 [Malus domestica]